MADNTTLNAGSGGDTIRTDDIGGVKYPVDKLAFGADGSATLASSTAPFPVDASVGGTVTVAGSGTFTVDGSGVTQPVSGTVTANAGTGTFTVDGSGVTQPVSGTVTASCQASASVTGLTPHFDSDGDNTAQAMKASAGNLYGLEVSNPNSADAYVQLFDVAAASVTVGVTTPALSLFVPAGDGTNDGAMDKSWPIPIQFSTAITYACTTTPTGSGDPTTGLVLNAMYA